MIGIAEATRSYEKWLGGHVRLLPADLKLKHERMKGDEFEFFRATYYRWAQLYPGLPGAVTRCGALLAVGDLHAENFGTWRDADGRLVWGVNDFDEAVRLPWTNDLVRLAASIEMATSAGRLKLKPAEACAALLAGYRAGLTRRGAPFVLEEKHLALRKLAVERLKDPGVFWGKLTALPAERGRIPGAARKAMEKALPAPHEVLRIVHRVAGLGSLGRERFVTLAEYAQSLVAREAKALAPSAAHWAAGRAGVKEIEYGRILKKAVRCADPFAMPRGQWMVRRLSPSCSRIELADLPRSRDERYLCEAMGFETANVHVGSGKRGALERELQRLGDQWLAEASAQMAEWTRRDWKEWRSA